jgi:hypothetical protein
VVRQNWCLLQATMDERTRRLWSGTEAGAIGWGDVAAVARATGMAISTVRKGRDEARRGATPEDVVKVRRSAGKRPYEVAHPEVWPALENLIDPITRGDPESPCAGRARAHTRCPPSCSCGTASGSATRR